MKKMESFYESIKLKRTDINYVNDYCPVKNAEI